MAPPRDFVDLEVAYNASANTFHSVIGVVVDLMAPASTRTGEWTLKFKLLDPKLRDAVYGSHGITVRFFKKDHQHLPRVSNLGDVVLIRNTKASSFDQQPVLLSNYQTTAVVFPAASIPDPSFQLAFQGSKRLECLGVPMDKEKVTLEEQAYAIALKSDMRDTVDGLPSTNLAGSNNSGFPIIAQGEPAMKRPRLSEPSLAVRAPADAPLELMADRLRHSDGPDRPAAQRLRQSTFGPKFKLIKELAHYDFADVCAQVVKKYPLPYGGCDLYVTDYTPNKAVWYYPPPEESGDAGRDGDEFGYSGGQPKRQFPGPYEWTVLKVNVKDPHAHFVNHKITENDFVLLRNVKMKIKSEGAKLEGDMWPDSRHPEQVQVRKLLNRDVDEIQAVLERKEKYWATRKTKVANQESAKLTKTEKRKIKKKEKAERKAAEAGAMDARLGDQAKAVDINPHVRCSNDEVPVTAIKEILDPNNERHINTPPGGETYIIPFINAKYRAHVRVVDYAPEALEDFAVPADREDEEDVSLNSISGVSWQTSQKHVWSFRLLLEDASSEPQQSKEAAERERVWVTFHHESAQYLLGNSVDDPADLRTDRQLLAKLREKMCILWGNLEERRVQLENRGGHDEDAYGVVKLSNRPFECCLMEYGSPVGEDNGMELEGEEAKGSTGFGYRRMYAAFGVTIT